MSYIEEFSHGGGHHGGGGGGHHVGGHGGFPRGRGYWGSNGYYGNGVGGFFAGWGYPYYWDYPYYVVNTEPNCERVPKGAVCGEYRPVKIAMDVNGTGIADEHQCCKYGGY